MQKQLLKAFRLTLSIIISLYLSMRLGLSSPDWAVTSAIVVSMGTGTVGEIQGKWWQRIVGHLIGGGAAFFMVWSFISSPVFFIFMTCLFCSTFAYLSLTNFLYKNLWRWVIIGFIVIVAGSLNDPNQAFDLLANRIGCVFIGSTVVFILHSIWPIDIFKSTVCKYNELLQSLIDWCDNTEIDHINYFLIFNQKLSSLRISLSDNHSDFKSFYSNEINLINRLHSIEKLARDIYAFKMNEVSVNDDLLSWMKLILIRIKLREKVHCPSLDDKNLSVKYKSTYRSIYNDLLSLTQLNIQTTKLGLLRWHWQNRMFKAGTDSALTSTTILFFSILICMLLWRFGWPDGGIVTLLTVVFLISSQYGERCFQTNFFYGIGFTLGIIYAFPFFFFVLPGIQNSEAFWLFIIILYFPLALLMYAGLDGNFALLMFPLTLVLNINSQNYVLSDSFFINYFNFILAIMAVVLISTTALNLFVIADKETILEYEVKAWNIDKNKYLNNKKNNVRFFARFERRTEIILSMYSKLDNNQKQKWKAKISLIPLMLTKIQKWHYITSIPAESA